MNNILERFNSIHYVYHLAFFSSFREIRLDQIVVFIIMVLRNIQKSKIKKIIWQWPLNDHFEYEWEKKSGNKKMTKKATFFSIKKKKKIIYVFYMHDVWQSFETHVRQKLRKIQDVWHIWWMKIKSQYSTHNNNKKLKSIKFCYFAICYLKSISCNF